MKFHEIPSRVIVGAYVLHTGMEKWKGDEDTANAVHGMAKTAYPILASVPPKRFLKMLAAGEMAVGASLLTPFVPTAYAGAILTGFSGSLLGLYARIPGMKRENSIWPTQQGTAISKDSWMLAIGLSLVIDGIATCCHKKRRRVRRDHSEHDHEFKY